MPDPDSTHHGRSIFRRVSVGLRIRPAIAVALIALVVVMVPGARLPREAGLPRPDPGASWIGNSGAGGPPGPPKPGWVQQDVRGIAVAPDGTVFATSDYDEGGREVGVYKDGRVVGGLAETHGFGRTGGSAIAVGGGQVLVAVAQTSEFAPAAPPGGHAYGVRTFDAATYQPQAVSGGGGPDRSTRLISTRGPVTGLAVTPNQLFVAVAEEGVVRVLERPGWRPLRTLSAPRPGGLVADGDGGVWVTSGDGVLHVSATGATLAKLRIPRPTAVAFDGAGRLFVSTDGPAQQVLVWDVGRPQPRQVDQIGLPGGMRSAPVGRAGPLRFDGIVGVGVDATGAVYVAAGLGGAGTDLRKATRDGFGWMQHWQLLALAFVDSADVDPRDPAVAYTARDRYRLDLDRPVGRQWTWEAHTVDRVRFPDDGRLVDDHRYVTPDILRVQGRLLMFVTGMYQEKPRFYRFEGDTAVPSTALPTRGWGWQVDSRGDLWSADGLTLRHQPFVGFTVAGDPRFGPAEELPAPEGFTSVQRVHFEAGSDVMYLSGWTREHPRPPGRDLEKTIGSEVVRYDGWSRGLRTPAWRIVVPYNRSGQDLRGLHAQIGLSVAGSRLFTVESGTSRVREYDVKNGAELRSWVPGDSVGRYVGVVDVPDGIRATQAGDGRYLVFVEEDHAAKVLLYDVRG